jgi:opacity protein-like surface antigen
MRRLLPILALTAACLLGRPSPAAADITAFLGFSPTPETRSARGLAVSVNLLILGFEFEYSRTVEAELKGAPGLTTGMFNVMLLTPTTGIQLYATAGGGFFRESLLAESETSFGTNLGGGAKITLAGPLRLRVDYRYFNLRGTPFFRNPHRFYTGIALAF